MSVDPTVLERVRELFRGRLNAPALELDRPLLEYGLDSVRSAELVIELEQLFGIDIPDAAAAALRTTRQVAEYVAVELRKAS
ncbi:acyl carrier protein [Nocardia otitidiscaviarum]|uniref:acyl carrier protein n=1 Tax=Nocardia otitidiscaviarum TaxID=1823 RepID=UPI0009DDA776|nr:acyl carrier protein [Nocardia otitidiscaviarum]MBF6484538.1 acyl carrier protein [Nocardia otitidiscaviarum]